MKELFDQVYTYEPSTGYFYNKITRCNAAIKGNRTGFIRKDGYIGLYLKGKFYLAHRVAFCMMTGNWPELQVDHINGCRTDNRWENLREVSGEVNCNNRHWPNKSNKLGVKGVSIYRGKYRVQKTVNKKQIVIGVFNTLEEALKHV